jgi:hypothetical protein
VEDRPPGVAAGIDARHDDLRRLTEPAEAGGEHAQARRPVDRVGGNAVETRELNRLGLDLLVDVDLPEGRRRTAHVAVGRDDDHVVSRGDERRGQLVESRRGDAVVVRDQDLHLLPSIIVIVGGSLPPLAVSPALAASQRAARATAGPAGPASGSHMEGRHGRLPVNAPRRRGALARR